MKNNHGETDGVTYDSYDQKRPMNFTKIPESMDDDDDDDDDDDVRLKDHKLPSFISFT